MNINFSRQFKHFGTTILVALLVLNVIMLITWGISSGRDLPMDYLMEDAASLLGYDQFIGFLTPIGVIVLAIGIGAVLLLTLARQKEWDEEQRMVLKALYFLAGISLFLAIDDLFLLHERVFTGLFQIGERRIFLAYGLIFAALFYIYRKGILSGPVVLLIFSFLFFGISLGCDVLNDKISMSYGLAFSMKILEDMGKLGGYLFWTAFILLKARGVLLAEAGD